MRWGDGLLWMYGTALALSAGMVFIFFFRTIWFVFTDEWKERRIKDLQAENARLRLRLTEFYDEEQINRM